MGVGLGLVRMMGGKEFLFGFFGVIVQICIVIDIVSFKLLLFFEYYSFTNIIYHYFTLPSLNYQIKILYYCTELQLYPKFILINLKKTNNPPKSTKNHHKHYHHHTSNITHTTMRSSYQRQIRQSDSSQLSITHAHRTAKKQGDKLNYVHQFDQAVSMIFRPKYCYREKGNKVAQTQRVSYRQRNTNSQKQGKSSSLEKSLSLLKKIKDYIIPEKLNFLSFKSNPESKQTHNPTLDTSKPSQPPNINPTPQPSNPSDESDRQFINPRQLKGQPQPNDTNSQKSLPPTVKISMPRKVSKDGSQSSRKSNRNEVVQIERGLRKSSSRKSERSNKSTQPNPTPAPSPKPSHIPFKKLKYFFTLSSTNLLHHSQSTITLLLGNQNQLDCIALSLNEGIMGTELLWSLRMSKASKEKGSIDAVVVDQTKGNFVVMMSNQIGVVEVWRYGQGGVGLVAGVGLEWRVKDMAMIKEGHLFMLYTNGLVQIYSIQPNSLKKRYHKPLTLTLPLTKSTTTQLQPLSISAPIHNTLTIYLCTPHTPNPSLFDLYITQLTYQTQTQLYMSPPRRVYSMKNQLKQQIRFQSYSRRFFFVYVGLEVFAVGKEGYMVDSARVDIQLDGLVMRYVGRGRLVVVTQGKIEEYTFVLNQNTAPYRLQIKSLDSIILPQAINPTLHQFFQLLPIFTPLPSPKSLYTQNHFLTTYIIAYQHRHQLNKKSSTGQVPYLLAFTRFISVENKAAKLFGFEGRDLAVVEMKEIEEKVDAAKKMGLGVREIYLDLWNRTKKRTVQDFCFLLDTLDYETISKEIQKKLKKQAMLYTQLLKIQNSCYYLLKKRVTSPQCTQTDLRNFIVSHFKIKKYFFYKDVARFCENQQAVRQQLKRPQRANNDLEVSRELKQGQCPFNQFEEPFTKRQNAEKEEKRLMFDIQAFYTYNQMELKSYLLHLFHRYFYQIAEVSPLTKPKEGQDNVGRRDKSGNGLFWARKKDYLLKIKIMMNNFRFQLKVVYEEFLQELLKLCQKGNVLVELLQDFEQILPTSYSRRCPSSDKTIQCQPKQLKDNQPTNELNINKRAQISRLKQSLSKSTKGQLQLQGIWRQVGPAQFTQHLYLQTVQNIYTRPLIAKLSNEVWFKRGLYSQHDFILKSRQELEQIDAKLRSPFIFYFFIDRVYETVKDITVRDRIVKMLDQGYREVMPDHLKGRVELYYRLWLEMKLLVKEYVEVVGRQARNPTNVNVGLRSTVLGHEFMSLVNVNFGKQQQNNTSLRSKGSKAQCSSSSMKSLYQTFLPPKPGHQPSPLQSFQNFLNLPETHLFLQFIKLEYILVGCIFHRIKPIYQQFPSGSAIFNQTINLYFQSPISQVSHLKCLLNRLNSESKEFQQEHFELFEVLVKSVLCKVVVGDKVAEKEYVNVDQLIIYVRDVYLRNQKQLLGREEVPFRISLHDEHFPKQLHDEHFPRQPQPSFSNSNTQSRISGVNLLQSSHQQSSQLLRLQPQPEPSPISTYFNMLGCVSQNKDLFRKLNIRISLYQIYELHRQNRTQTITTLIVEYLIKEVGLYEQVEYEEFLDKTVDILVQAALILNKLFTSPATFIQQLNHPPQNHNEFPGPWSTQGFYQQPQTKQQEEGNYENELFFILVWKIMSQERFLYDGWVGQLLQNKDIVSNYLVNDMLKQNLVIFMAKYRFSIDKLFVNNIKYLQHLIQLLPQKNKIRRYFSAQIQLVKSIEPTLQPYYQPKTGQQQNSNKVRPLITNPLTENSEIISIYHIQEIFSLYPTQYLLTLDLQRICSIINEMQRILLQVAVKERLADQSGHHDKSMGQSHSRVQSDHEDAFGKFQRQNSCKFIMSLEKSFCHGNQGNANNNANNNGVNANSNVNVLSNNNLNWQQIQTPVFPSNHPYSSNNQCSTPFCETPIAISNKEIILSQLQTLIKQSAQPHTFFNETEQRLIRSFREHRSITDKKLSSSKLLNEACSRKSLWDGDKSDRSAIIGISSLRELKNYYTSLSQLYELVVKRLINSEMIREVLPYLQKLLGLTVGHGNATSNQLYIVYPLLILNVLSKELIQENKLLLVRICSHLFRQPVELLKFIRELVGRGYDISKSYMRQLNNSGMKQSLNGFRYSMKELNQKLVEYERQTRVYRVEALDPIEHGRQAKDDTRKDTKKRLKKKLTILIDHQPQPSSPPQPPSTVPLNSHPSIPLLYYMKRPFSYQNPLISHHCINSITSQEQKLLFVNQIWELFELQLREKELFSKDFQFMLMNVMLFQEPYTIVKYLETKLKGWYYAKKENEGGMGQGIMAQSSHMLKFKPLMTYFNEMIKQSVINPLHLLEFGKRMFYMLYSTIVERSSIQYQIRQYYDIPLAQTLPCDQFPTTPFISEVYVAKFRQSIQAFAKKHKQIRKKMSSSGKFLPENNLGNPKNDEAQQKSPRKLSIIEPSPKSNLDKSKMDQSNLLQISYNNIDDEIPQNLEVPILSQNPSKISQNSKMEESFDPSRERDLVNSRGEKRFSAMLSNNNSSIVLKNKLSPKSIRSSKAPSIITVSGAVSKRKNNRFFPSRKSPYQQQKRTKKTFNCMIQCKQSSDQEISYQQQSVIFQQQFQNSRQVSQSDSNGNNMMFVAPPRLNADEGDFMMEGSVESRGEVESKEFIGELRQVTRFSEEEGKADLRVDTLQKNQLYTSQFTNGMMEKQGKSNNMAQIKPNDLQTKENTKQFHKQTEYHNKDQTINQNKQESVSQTKQITSQINLSASKKKQDIQQVRLQISDELKIGKQVVQMKRHEQKNENNVKFKRDRKEEGKGARKLLTLEIPDMVEESRREQVKRGGNVTNDKSIKGITNTPKPTPKQPPNHLKPSIQQQSRLRQRISQLFRKNSIQGFVLTQLQDIHQKFKQYWQRWDLMNSSLMQVKEVEGRNVGEEEDGVGFQLSRQSVGDQGRLGEVFGVGEVYGLVLGYLEQKMKVMSVSLPESEILLQELKDKLFYEICLKRLVDFYTTEDNIQAVAKIIDMAFKKKIFLTDYYYEVVSKIQVFKIEELAEKVIQQQGKRVIKEGGQQIQSIQIRNNSSLTTFNRPSTLQANRSLVNGYRLPSPTSRNIIPPSPKAGRGLTSPKSHVNTTPRHVQTSQLSRLQDALERQMQKVELLLQKIPLNILQFRKKELMLKLKPGKDLGRKYLLDVLVKVFEKKKDKRLGQQLYQRMRNIIDKDIK